jgi:poly-gamma-glutamate synthesis protein (capsule biosynthesis protein)
MTAESSDSALHLAFVGDVNLGGPVRTAAAEADHRHPLEQVQGALAGMDLVVANLECCLVPDNELAAAARPRMTAAESQLPSLRAAGINVVSLANNHVLDAGRKHVPGALRALEEAGLRHLGAGLDRTRAEAVLEVDIRGWRIALVAACDQSAYWAGRGRAGVAPLHWRQLRAAVAAARARCDVVIAILHADYEFMPTPSPKRVRQSRKLARAGAHLVVQHHPHVFQGVERHGDSLIAYSLGNFVFGLRGAAYLASWESVADSFVLQVRLEKRPNGELAPEWSVVPVVVSPDGPPRLAEGADARRIRDELRRRSELLSDRGALRRYWLAACRWESRQSFYAVANAAARGEWRSAMRQAGAALMRPDKRRGLLGRLSRGWL